MGVGMRVKDMTGAENKRKRQRQRERETERDQNQQRLVIKSQNNYKWVIF